MTSIRASIASRATELRPTASSEKSRERLRFPSCVFLACCIVSHCACCQDIPPPPSPPRLDSPSLRPSLAAVQLRELLQAGSFAVRSVVRPQISVRAWHSESPVHSPLQRGRASASWLAALSTWLFFCQCFRGGLLGCSSPLRVDPPRAACCRALCCMPAYPCGFSESGCWPSSLGRWPPQLCLSPAGF